MRTGSYHYLYCGFSEKIWKFWLILILSYRWMKIALELCFSVYRFLRAKINKWWIKDCSFMEYSRFTYPINVSLQKCIISHHPHRATTQTGRFNCSTAQIAAGRGTSESKCTIRSPSWVERSIRLSPEGKFESFIIEEATQAKLLK